MIDPKQHAAEHGWIETILRTYPDFGAIRCRVIVAKAIDSPASISSTRLGAIKQKLDAFQEQLVNAGNLDDLMQCERVVNAIMTLGNRISRGRTRLQRGSSIL